MWAVGCYLWVRACNSDDMCSASWLTEILTPKLSRWLRAESLRNLHTRLQSTDSPDMATAMLSSIRWTRSFVFGHSCLVIPFSLLMSSFVLLRRSAPSRHIIPTHLPPTKLLAILAFLSASKSSFLFPLTTTKRTTKKRKIKDRQERRQLTILENDFWQTVSSCNFWCCEYRTVWWCKRQSGIAMEKVSGCTQISVGGGCGGKLYFFKQLCSENSDDFMVHPCHILCWCHELSGL